MGCVGDVYSNWKGVGLCTLTPLYLTKSIFFSCLRSQTGIQKRFPGGTRCLMRREGLHDPHLFFLHFLTHTGTRSQLVH